MQCERHGIAHELFSPTIFHLKTVKSSQLSDLNGGQGNNNLNDMRKQSDKSNR